MLHLRRGGGLALLATGLLLAGCSSGGGAAPTPQTTASATDSSSASPSDSGSPSASASDTASPGSASPDTASPGTPGASDTPSGSATPGSTPTGPQSACTTVTPVRVQDVNTDPRRITEVVTVVSDGRTVTSGTRDQTDFLSPSLTGPDGSVVTDDATTKGIAALVAGQKHRVLLTRPDPPDTNLSVAKKPFSSTGTYVVFNASSQLTATVVVQCSGQQQNWTFVSEADPSVGQVNCAVEPSKANNLARQAYMNNC